MRGVTDAWPLAHAGSASSPTWHTASCHMVTPHTSLGGWVVGHLRGASRERPAADLHLVLWQQHDRTVIAVRQHCPRPETRRDSVEMHCKQRGRVLGTKAYFLGEDDFKCFSRIFIEFALKRGWRHTAFLHLLYYCWL